ncbi:hypothetical protein AAG906_023748 [Vitis piasezkii]|uniref:Uncharacterized protein n=1 Tax=Vitis vinifera TaxID=29760 RepID=A0A438HU85_VITVI|nr:uncharacterized protein LOC109123196 [Vitis vinifera]RVW88005.1 hypothetical protein CK203_033942 [Vitis vinifera]|eukprot:XP_019077716.1 PREDICTED: uncharacterized protein LOC109123196 [Vitis vinifera]
MFLGRMTAMSETGARKLAVMVITLILLAAAVAQADTDCSSKCARQCSYSLFPTTCLQGCFKKCKHSFSVALFGIGCTFGCTNSKCAHLGSVWQMLINWLGAWTHAPRNAAGIPLLRSPICTDWEESIY